MKRGKAICRTLKDVRQCIADANGISYRPHECHYEGECQGTCPACEKEKAYLEYQLEVRRRLGKAVSVVGVAAGVGLLSPSPASAQCVDASAVDSVQIGTFVPADTLAVEDLTLDGEDGIVVRGRVVDEEQESVLGVIILLKGTSRGKVVTNLNGQFAVRVPVGSTLVFSYIGYDQAEYKVKEATDSLSIMLAPSVTLMGDVVTVGGVMRGQPTDDVYGW